MRNRNIVYVLSLFVFIGFACQNNNQKESESQQKEVVKADALTTFDSLNMRIQNNPTDPMLYNRRANFYLVAGENNKALADVNRALQLDSVNADIWVTLADVYFASERFVDSREVLIKAMNLDPKNTSALLKLARLYFIYKEYETAMSFVDKALELDPMLEDAYFIKGMTYAELGDTTTALFNYQKSVEVDPDFYDAWIMLGNMQAAKGNSLAEQYYRNALDLDTNNTHAIYVLALYYQESGQLEHATREYESLLAKEENKNALFNLGYINLVIKEDYPEAISYFYQALKVDPDYHDALFNLALALELSGDKEDARIKYKELLRKVPNHERALKQLNQLDN